MSESNGKYQIAFWAMSVLIIGAFSWSTWCFFLNQGSIMRNTERYYALKEIANDTLHAIDLRLSRIENKLDIK